MRVEKLGKCGGVTVNLEPEECAVLVKLAQDAESASVDLPGVFQTTGSSYFTVSLNIGRRISALLDASVDRQGKR